MFENTVYGKMMEEEAGNTKKVTVKVAPLNLNEEDQAAEEISKGLWDAGCLFGEFGDLEKLDTVDVVDITELISSDLRKVLKVLKFGIEARDFELIGAAETILNHRLNDNRALLAYWRGEVF